MLVKLSTWSSGDPNARRSHSIKIDNTSFERVEQFKCLGTTLTYQNSVQEEIKSRLKSGNACHHSVQNRLSSSLQSKNIEIKIYRNIILPVVLYGCETWSLTLREECTLMVFENRVLRRIFGPKRAEVISAVLGPNILLSTLFSNTINVQWRKLRNEELNDLYLLQNIIRAIKSRRMRWSGHVARMGRGALHTGFLWGNPRETG